MNRKIIQVIRMPKDAAQSGGYDCLIAVCDDGTLWWSNYGESEPWQQYAAIPQHPSREPKEANLQPY